MILTEPRSMDRSTIGLAALIIATWVVGVSIATEGTLSKGLNGLAGLIWFAAAVVYLMEGWSRDRRRSMWLLTIGLTAVVAFVSRPSDLVLASIGFLLAGGASALMHRDGAVFWSTMIPALYLPLHIGIAVLKAVGRSVLGLDASIRTDPPPTAVVVPFVMVVAALVAGYLVSKMRTERHK